MSPLPRRTFLKQIGFSAAGLALAASPASAALFESGAHLPRSTPEEQGMSSQGILEFLDAMGKSKHEFHSFMIVRHGHVVAEGWWTPYRAKANHMLYSLSKSFTSTAVGFAVTEKKLTVDAPVISFFPDKLPSTISDDLAALRVKHLLTMSVGVGTDGLQLARTERDWVKAFLGLPFVHPPGTVFMYNSGATYMLSAIVQKVTGQKVIDYLRPRLFEPLRIEGMTWETCPLGINTGGWGLSVPTEALAKFGQFYLQRGKWRGRQLLPAGWIEEATTFKIQQPVPAGTTLEQARRTNDWEQGYCYQFWRCRHDAFRGDGAFGQLMVVMPDQDAVVAVTCETGDMHGELSLVWDHLLPAMHDAPLPTDDAAQRQLKHRTASLTLPLPQSQTAPATPVSAKPFQIEPNDSRVKWVSFDFSSSRCAFKLADDKGEYEITCGLGKWVEGNSTMPGTPPKISPADLRPCKVAAAGSWPDENTFVMLWRFYETPHSITVACHFDGEKVRIEATTSIERVSSKLPKPYLTLQGKLAA